MYTYIPIELCLYLFAFCKPTTCVLYLVFYLGCSTFAVPHRRGPFLIETPQQNGKMAPMEHAIYFIWITKTKKADYAVLTLLSCAVPHLAQSIRGFARSCMSFSLSKGWDLFLSTKNTILKVWGV